MHNVSDRMNWVVDAPLEADVDEDFALKGKADHLDTGV